MQFRLDDDEYESLNSRQQVLGDDFFDSAFTYWLRDREDFRSPFPGYMHGDLQSFTRRWLIEWFFLDAEDDDRNAEAVSLKFTEAIHEVGLALARDEEDRLTILYPELPRPGDEVSVKGEGDDRDAEILSRELEQDEGRTVVNVVFKFADTGEKAMTTFEIA